jgi:Leucine-rich repeat (LRR) protein
LRICRVADFSQNELESVGRIFAGFNPAGYTIMNFSDNLLSENDLTMALGSYILSVASLTLDFSRNNVLSLPAQLLSNISTVAAGYGNVTIILAENPIAVINESVFVSTTPNLFSSVTIDISSATAGRVQIPTAFVISNVGFVGDGALLSGLDSHSGPPVLNINAANTSINMSFVQALGALGQVSTPINSLLITVNLSLNGYTEIPEGSFSNVLPMLQSIDLSFNNISLVPHNAFSNSAVLEDVYLSNNNIEYFSDTTFANCSALQNVDMTNNVLTFVSLGVHLAAPFATFNLSNNHIVGYPRLLDPSIVVDNNPLTCPRINLQTYNNPTTEGCTCPSGLMPVITTCFNYVVCMNATYNCSASALPVATNCSQAPWPECFEQGDIPSDQYYVPATKSFQALSVCSQMYPMLPGQMRTAIDGDDIPGPYTHYMRAYQVVPPTLTTNRLCSICSTCPSGYDTVPCTEYTNTQCRKVNERNWITTVIVVCTVVPVVVMSIALMYIFKRRALTETTTNLELTERLLDGQRDEVELMGQAWSIAMKDLTFGDVIGEGAYGRVWNGTWGHVPVAIKVLRTPFDELDLNMQADFEREVS